MVKTSEILGMNARSMLFTSKYNRKRGKRVADHKLLTKTALSKAGINTPKLYRVFRHPDEIDKFDFSKKLPDSFVIKPDNSMGGEGIMVIESLGPMPGEWMTTENRRVDASDFKLLIGDILEGRFSMDSAPDIAFIEERIRVHPAFIDYTWAGTPDIGVLVFNHIPVMAYLRLPTKESGGRANMHQGAIAAGIDMATGITTHAIKYTTPIRFYPETRRKLTGIQIPEWDEILRTAINCQLAVPELGFMRVDIVLQPSLKKPGKTILKVLELNALPGLKIQIANQSGLLSRLRRIEGLEVPDVEKGIRIAKALFADPKLRDVSISKKVIGVFETVLIQPFVGEPIEVKAKIDTGAYSSSLDEQLARQLGLLNPENVLMEQGYRSALGKENRSVVDLTFWLAGRKIKTTASVTDRSHMKRMVIIGRKDLAGFLIETEK
jgi:alpha-L-glutamate ligase-like protein